MRPNPRFLNQPKEFWAYVRYASELLGYFGDQSTGQFRSVSIADILDGFTTVTAKLPVKSPPDFSDLSAIAVSTGVTDFGAFGSRFRC